MNITLNTDPTKGDSYTKSELKKETACVFIPENQYMYCQISDTYIAPEDNRVKVTITYLDEGTGDSGYITILQMKRLRVMQEIIRIVCLNREQTAENGKRSL